MIRKTLILTLLMILMLTACSPASPASGNLIFTDGLDREVQLDGTPQRIVSLAPSNTEILFAVSAGSQVVGRDEFSDYPPEATSIESIGGSFGEYNVEAIVALEPDLVLAAEINPPELVQQLEDLGLTVYYLSNPTTLEEMYTNLETVASLSGHESTELVDSLKARVAAVDEKIMPLSSRIPVFYEIDASDPTKPWTYGPGTFGDLLISRAGGYNIGGNAENDPYPQLSLEQIVASNPSVIILGDAIWGVTPESVAERAGWETIPAVVSGQIFPIDDNLISRPGPRLVDGLEQLAKLLRPELFE
ncbi:MAG TPA: cobalamin-binding protein [Anaerolineales bacterium]|nr:cobalamin-binding protein [Anaerolineales bacterium]